MEVVVRHNGAEYEVNLDTAGDDGTIADLVAAWFDLADPVFAVNGRSVGGDVPVAEAGLASGSVLEIAVAGEPRQHGLLFDVGDQSTTRSLGPGVTTIGAAPSDVEVSGVAGRVRLLTDGAGTFSLRNPEGVAVDLDGESRSDARIELPPGSRFRIGSDEFILAAAGPLVPRRRGVFNRPPRVVARKQESALRLPEPPPEPGKAMRFGWGALIVPVVLGVAMAFLIHPRMAMFAVFSPVMLLANWIEDRRRLKRERREASTEFGSSLSGFASEVADAYRSDVERQHRSAITPAELRNCVVQGDTRLWERRPDHADFLVIPVGSGCVAWKPALHGTPTPEASAVLGRYAEMHDVPISVELRAGGVTGIAGPRSRVMELARQMILQAAVTHGPADVALSIFTETVTDWDWAKWLPHVVVDDAGRRRLAGSEAELSRVAALLPDGEDAPRSPHHLLVVDLPDLFTGERKAIRAALREGRRRGVSGVALATRPIDLPSVSTTIISLGDEGSWIRFPDGDQVLLTPWGVGSAAARATARGLACVEDPEVVTAGAGLPSRVHLSALLGCRDDVASLIARNWSRRAGGVAAPLGVGRDGVVAVDLVADGPHALLGGTTGAGKSELLRTFVAGLATTTSPLDLNLILVDYKGGSAFDACAALPHTVGMVTDLDDHLARRALTCLEAELRYRERRLREIGVSDIAMAAGQGLPRLLVVIDEFAALAKELPDFMEALVDVAQRGRSLGVHLLLATQRPNGVISDSIKANTNLRVALRVQDNADSIDVIGCTDAAAIGRNQPGRGLARLGPRDVVAFQTALVTGRSLGGHAVTSRVQPFVFAHEQPAPTRRDPDEATPTDLEQIVTAAERVATTMDLPPARLPWPDALPHVATRDDLSDSDVDHATVAFALADEPHRQRQLPATWSPAAGNLLMFGLPGSGTTTAVASIVAGLADSSDPNQMHIYVLDFDDQALRQLEPLVHVGAVIGASERERQVRLLRRLAVELGERRQRVSADPQALRDCPVILTILDNYSGFADAFDETGDMGIRNLFTRLVADGPGVGMFTIATAKHPGDVPTRVGSLIGSKLAFRLADRYDYSGLGVPPVDPPAVPGRAFEAGSGRELQILLPHRDGLAAAVADVRQQPPVSGPWSVEILPNEVPVSSVIGAGFITPEEWFLPLGIGDTAMAPAGLVLREGDHALITGPARSGKSTALATLATVARAAYPDMHISALLPRHSPLSDCGVVDTFGGEEAIADVAQGERPQLLLVDDAELIGESRLLSDLVRQRRPDLHIVAAGSPDAIRGLYGHWTQDVRRSRIGCALRPNLAADGDLWQTPLPRRGPELFPAGRGYLLADGQAELVQLGSR